MHRASLGGALAAAVLSCTVANTPSPNRPTLGAVGFADGALASFQRALEPIAALEPLPSPVDAAARSAALGAVLFALDPPLTRALNEFCAVRQSYPLVPILVFAEGVDANFAAELLKCGADDFLLLPAAAEVLQHKVSRALGHAVGPAFDTPEFQVFKPRAVDMNQRHCYRVVVPPDLPVAGKFPGPVERPLEVRDLSIETEKAPGGLQIVTDRSTARRLPFDQWYRRRDIELVVELPTGPPISARARVVPGLRHFPDGSIRFAVEYWVTRPVEKERFRRYWIEAQRRSRRMRK